MPKISLNLRLLLTLILTVSFLTACDREKPASVSPATSETPVVEPQQSSIEPTEPTAQPQSTAEQSAIEEKTATAAEEDTIVTEQATPAATSSPASTSDNSSAHAESLALARKSGCLACHAIDKKVVGPPWRDVAKRYANNADARAQLIEKVSSGGKGNWTDVVGNVAMPPYYPRVSKENIEKLVDFVLSLSD